MKLGLDQVAQDLKDIVDGDHVFGKLGTSLTMLNNSSIMCQEGHS